MTLPVRRRVVAGRQARRPRRRGRLLNRWRVVGAGLMLLSAAALGWLLGADEFTLDEARLELGGLRYTDAALVRSTMAPWLDADPNLFTLPAAELEAALRDLPAVADSEVRVVLPDRLVVAIIERVPVFIWSRDDGDFLVDAEGVLLREVLADERPAHDLPVLDDERRRFVLPGVGALLERVDLDAVLKLAAIDAEQLGSDATGLVLSADDEDGYVLTAEPSSWRAVFGHYTPTLRPPEIIDRQVQCLRSLLGEEEPRLVTIYLAPADDRCGTFRARRTPAASPDDGEGEP